MKTRTTRRTVSNVFSGLLVVLPTGQQVSVSSFSVGLGSPVVVVNGQSYQYARISVQGTTVIVLGEEVFKGGFE